MEKLPQEMVDLIAHHLGNIWWIKDSRKIPLSNYATISKKWKKAIESIVFKYIRVRDLDKAQQILGASGGRWSYVRHITYHIPLAGPGPDFAARMKSLLEFINHHWVSTVVQIFNLPCQMRPLQVITNKKGRK